MWAAANRHPEVVRLLLGARADLRARTHSWRQMMAVPPHGYPAYNREIPHGSYTALLFAVRAGDLESAKLLVAAGADVNDEDAWGVSATVLAAHAGFTELAVFLLDKGADPNASRAGFTALHCAIMRRDEPLVRALLARGADPGAPLKTWTPTRRSSRDWNFDPKLVGATPLWLAARFQQPEVMRLLAARGADGRFVHHSRYVAEKDYSEKSESLTTLMAALGAGGGAAWTPPSGNRDALTLETVRAALDLGADIHARTTGGRTALDLARESGQPADVIALLMAACRSSGPGLCPPDRADASSPPR
jgi:ankyrin repeat protein